MIGENEEETAWVAGIYEGEGSCHIGRGRGISVTIIMTDRDVVDRVCIVVGLGSVKARPVVGEYKQCFEWSIHGHDAVIFLAAILPLLGNRRSAKAKEAIQNWTTNRKQISKGDTHCTKGHELTPENSRATGGVRGSAGVVCVTCERSHWKAYRERKAAREAPQGGGQ